MDFIKIDKKEEGYVIVELNRPKVNAINFQMVQEIRETFKQLGEDDTVKGVILTGLSGVFSAGLDLIELYDFDETQMGSFFLAFGSMHKELAMFPKPFISAIGGHCPAGGTVITVTSDYRVMADNEKYKIGLNEMAVNVQISINFVEAYTYWLGRGTAYRYLMEGKLMNPQEALETGLVDEIVPLEEVLDQAEKKMQVYLQAEPTIWSNTKAKLRRTWFANLTNEEASQQELEEVSKVWWSPSVRAKLGAFVSFLKNKNKK